MGRLRWETHHLTSPAVAVRFRLFSSRYPKYHEAPEPAYKWPSSLDLSGGWKPCKQCIRLIFLKGITSSIIQLSSLKLSGQLWVSTHPSQIGSPHQSLANRAKVPIWILLQRTDSYWTFADSIAFTATESRASALWKDQGGRKRQIFHLCSLGSILPNCWQLKIKMFLFLIRKKRTIILKNQTDFKIHWFIQAHGMLADLSLAVVPSPVSLHWGSANPPTIQ